MRLQQRIYRSATTDSSRWAAYVHRPGDIFVCTPAKVWHNLDADHCRLPALA